MLMKSTLLPHSEILDHLLALPTAPFREQAVMSFYESLCLEFGVPYFFDKVGNLVLGTSSLSDYKKILNTREKEPVRVFIAHTDHPGFHGVKWASTTELEIFWHGGSPTHFLENASVWVSDSSYSQTQGRLTRVKMTATGKAMESAVIVFDHEPKQLLTQNAKTLFGAFQFQNTHWIDGSSRLLYTKAADDLIGTFAIFSQALAQFKSGKKKNSKLKSAFIGVLTRAEEVGWVGFLEHLSLGVLQKAKRPVICVSLETSRQLPGAEIGKGPIVRLGDRATIFDAGATLVFANEVAAKVLPNMHQKRVMDGGSCEATPAMAYGLTTIAISIPLGNYHNQCFEGGPEAAGPNGPAPEFVHIDDLKGMLALCEGLMKPGLPWANPWKAKHEDFKKLQKKYKAMF